MPPENRNPRAAEAARGALSSAPYERFLRRHPAIPAKPVLTSSTIPGSGTTAGPVPPGPAGTTCTPFTSTCPSNSAATEYPAGELESRYVPNGTYQP